MLGWFADSFRFAWALLYWNTRKSWFRLGRGRVACPCQSPSDSGRAFETRCDACLNWERPERFSRVCPLLVRTPEGLRCSANTPDVRPFWGVFVRYYGGAVLALYVAVVLTVFGFLRTIGYPVSIVHVGWPPLWHRVGQARGWFYLTRAQKAFAAGNTREGLLYLSTSYEFDPENYDAGLALAKQYQLPHPERSDEIFSKLLHEHAERRDLTAQQWFRALLARGDFDQLAPLAANEVLRDPAHASAWMRSLLFATRQNGDEKPLRMLLTNHTPQAVVWRKLIQTELQLRAGRNADVLAAIEGPWPSDSPPYTVVYRTETLARLGQPGRALDLLEQQRTRIDVEAWLTVRLHCLAESGATQAVRNEITSYLLTGTLRPPAMKLICAQLIRHPDEQLFDDTLLKVLRDFMPLNDETAGSWFSLLCAAGAVGNTAQLHNLILRLREASQSPFIALAMVESFFRDTSPDRKATSFLPYLPVPTEVAYALIERYPGPRATSAAPTVKLQ